jgi:putrescine importer
VAAYSFIGFDAVSTFAEEAVDPRRTVPRAIVLTAAIAGSIFVAVAFVTQLVHPGGLFENPDSAALDIARAIGGDLFSAIFLATVIVAQFTAGIPIQAAGSRLMYAMGRDGVIPRKFFGYVSARFRTPVLNLLLTGAIGVLALLLDVSTSTSFINFGAFTAFAFVNISVIALFWRTRGQEERNAVSWTVQPFIGFLVIVWLLTNLDTNALVIGTVWLILGFVWLLYLTRMFRRPPPEMTLAEPDTTRPSA